MRLFAIGLLFASALCCASSPAAAQCGRRAAITNDIRSAIGVAEPSHAMEATIAPDFVGVETSFSLRTSSTSSAEVAYRMTMSGSTVGFTVCADGRCREAVADSSRLSTYMLSVNTAPGGEGPFTPVGRLGVAPYRWRQPRQPELLLAPLSAGQPLDVSVRSQVPAQLFGGTVYARLFITGLGVETTVRVSAPGLENLRIDGVATREVSRTPGTYVYVEADLPAGAPTVISERAACGGRRCRWTWLGSPRAGRARDVIVLLDASSSMADVGPSNLQRVFEGLRGAMPEGSTARVIAFGRTVETPVPEPVPAAALDPRALAAVQLGNRTQTALIWPTVRRWIAESERPLLVAITDGRAVFEPPDGVEFSAIALHHRRYGVPSAGPYGAITAERGGQQVALVEALALRPAEGMESRVRRLFAPELSEAVQLDDEAAAPLRAGEGRSAATLERSVGMARGLPIRARRPSASRAAWLGRWLQRQVYEPSESRPTLVAVADGAEQATHAFLAGGRDEYAPIPGAVPVDHHRTPAQWGGACDRPTARDRHPACGRRRARIPHIRAGCAQVRGSLSRQTLQRMMHSARPAVNACLASARAGRRDWNARFMYELVIGNREVHVARVSQRSSTITDRAAQCLLGRPIDNLVIPAVDDGGHGRVRINYPFSTQPDLPPASISLDPSVDEALEGVFGTESSDGQDL